MYVVRAIKKEMKIAQQSVNMRLLLSTVTRVRLFY